ncbi:uncharacterized protein LOC121998196 [Zingiber officinale]|uniref:uncharacterized protein LOC121998196 n=1 Tax=Zingiber officinale TaxID=94328 RepID=UPI001C4AFBB2|nr:uncharacterized protein LOC121998196 [Zingiber officinale]
MWMIIKTGISLPLDGLGKLVSCKNWDASLIKKVEANTKATYTLQCGLTKEEQNRVGSFASAKDLWEKLIKMHEGTSDMKDGESASQLHARIQELLNDLHAIGQEVENRDVKQVQIHFQAMNIE